MNKAEIKEFLNETKVYVNGKSEKIQEKLFSLGCLWIVDDNPVIQDVGKPFIFIDKGLKLTNGDDMLYSLIPNGFPSAKVYFLNKPLAERAICSVAANVTITSSK